jgi:alginate O-acetyltransferase complex protein AlgJ
MSGAEDPIGRAEEAREAQAAREVGRTDVSPAVARSTTAAFLLLLLAVAGLELRRDARRGSGSPWPELLGAPAQASRAARAGLLDANLELAAAIESFEDALEERSLVAAAALPRVQWLLTRALRTGNEQVVVGRKGWLYFRPDVDYLAGRGFPEARRPGGAAAGGSSDTERSADAPRALADFAAQLSARGIALVLVPTPVKPALHPEGLSPSISAATLPLENPSFAAFAARMGELEIPVYSPAARLAAARRLRDWPQFLRTDTHWTPQAMESAAEGLAEFLRRHVALPERDATAYTRRQVALESRGDLLALLRLPARRPLFRPESVLVQRVFTDTGEPWAADVSSDILLLGDSFTNIYSQPELGWGDAAGFAEQLSYFLGRSLDKLAVNAGGPAAVRERLAAALAAGEDRLAGKRLVVYQFAARELTSWDWRLVDLDAAQTSAASRPRHRPERGVAARGFVVWESNRSGDWRIWTRRLEGSPARQLSPDEPERQHCCAHVSPDGTRVVYLSRSVPRDEYPDLEVAGELRLLRLDSGATEVLAEDARPYGWGNRAVLWRSDSELIYVGADGRTFLLDVLGRQRSALTREPRRKLAWLIDPTLRHAVDGSPTFSAYDVSARRVLEGERRAGCEPYFSHDGRFGIWVEGAGGPIRKLDLATGATGTLLEQDDRRIADAQRYAYFPMLSADSRVFVFGASPGDHDHFRSNYDIFAAPVDPESLELLGRPLRITAHPNSDRYPDVHVDALDLERWRREAPAVAVADARRPAAPPASAGPIEVRAELRACSRVPSLREISPYRAALVVCEWQVGEVLAGEYPAPLLRVAHWGLRDGERQPIVSAAPGTAAQFRAEPLRGVVQIEGYTLSNTLPAASELPLYWSR